MTGLDTGYYGIPRKTIAGHLLKRVELYMQTLFQLINIKKNGVFSRNNQTYPLSEDIQCYYIVMFI